MFVSPLDGRPPWGLCRRAQTLPRRPRGLTLFAAAAGPHRPLSTQLAVSFIRNLPKILFVEFEKLKNGWKTLMLGNCERMGQIVEYLEHATKLNLFSFH